jgi:hypothetical protein
MAQRDPGRIEMSVDRVYARCDGEWKKLGHGDLQHLRTEYWVDLSHSRDVAADEPTTSPAWPLHRSFRRPEGRDGNISMTMAGLAVSTMPACTHADA